VKLPSVQLAQRFLQHTQPDCGSAEANAAIGFSVGSNYTGSFSLFDWTENASVAIITKTISIIMMIGQVMY
jgi:hypothetical protein